jgi:hypothetical protein
MIAARRPAIRTISRRARSSASSMRRSSSGNSVASSAASFADASVTGASKRERARIASPLAMEPRNRRRKAATAARVLPACPRTTVGSPSNQRDSRATSVVE